MLGIERQQKIMELFQTNSFLSVIHLRDQLFFSEATSRRDLEELEQQGLIRRIRGGAICNSGSNVETPLAVRAAEHNAEKKRIARKAADLVRDNDVLFLDASTTVMELIPFLAHKANLTIITNCLQTSTLVAEQIKCTLICTGGTYHRNTASLVGTFAESCVTKKFADIFLFSVQSVDSKNGLTDQGEEVANLKSTMMRQAKSVVLLADSSKFGRTAFCKVAPLSEVTSIITNRSNVFENECWNEFRTKLHFAED